MDDNCSKLTMKPVSIERFNALAGYIRSPWTSLSAKELAWYEAGDEKLLGCRVPRYSPISTTLRPFWLETQRTAFGHSP